MYGLVEAIDAMERAVAGEMLPLMLEIGQGVADDAKTGHTFQNRSGRLEGSIRHGAASGSLRHGYHVDVTARRPYASYLEDGTATIQGYAYLWPAWERREAWAENLAETELTAALSR